jgi:hypothetical protein
MRAIVAALVMVSGRCLGSSLGCSLDIDIFRNRLNILFGLTKDLSLNTRLIWPSGPDRLKDILSQRY